VGSTVGGHHSAAALQEALDSTLARASAEAKALFADNALLKRYDELVVAKHQYAASQSESSQADHRVAAERLRSEQAVTSAVAHSADDRPLGAHILGCMADQAARHGRAAEAVTLIETAVVGIRGGETPRLLAELYIRKAYALATMKDGSACVAAVAKARTQVEQFEPDSDPRWLYWVTPAEITAGRATVCCSWVSLVERRRCSTVQSLCSMSPSRGTGRST
jgi:hypothetical protein